jgi:hypothetical protein
MISRSIDDQKVGKLLTSDFVSASLATSASLSPTKSDRFLVRSHLMEPTINRDCL